MNMGYPLVICHTLLKMAIDSWFTFQKLGFLLKMAIDSWFTYQK